jgi:hypothetical protein
VNGNALTKFWPDDAEYAIRSAWHDTAANHPDGVRIGGIPDHPAPVRVDAE